MHFASALLYLLLITHNTCAEVGETDLNDLSEQQNSVKINKCCESNELMVDSVCRLADQYNQSKYLPAKLGSVLLKFVIHMNYAKQAFKLYNLVGRYVYLLAL